MAMRLLLVDDHTHIRRRLRGVLEEYGFTVVGEAPTGATPCGSPASCSRTSR